MSYDIKATMTNAAVVTVYEEVDKIGRARSMAEGLTRRGFWTSAEIYYPASSIFYVAVTEHVA